MTVYEHDAPELSRLNRRDLDRLLDPETGIYARLTAIENRALRWLVGLMGLGLVDAALLILNLTGRR